MCGERERSIQQEWLREAERAYKEFEKKRAQDGGKLGTFRQLEEQACEAGDQLARLLIQGTIDDAAQSAASDNVECPRCAKPARALEGGAAAREVRAKPGPVGLERRGFYCPSCRKAFFPSGPRARPQS